MKNKMKKNETAKSKVLFELEFSVYESSKFIWFVDFFSIALARVITLFDFVHVISSFSFGF